MSDVEIRKKVCNHDWKCRGIFAGSDPWKKNIHEVCSKCGTKVTRNATLYVINKR